MSILPCSSRIMFSALPLVFWVCTSNELSVSLMVAAALSPNSGNPPPGVAVAMLTLVCAFAADINGSVSAARNASRANFIGVPRGEVHRGRSLAQLLIALIYLSGRRQALFEIGDDVVLVFDTDREPHHVGPGARLGLLRVGQLAVRGRGRMNDQRARVADVCKVREQFDVGDE